MLGVLRLLIMRCWGNWVRVFLGRWWFFCFFILVVFEVDIVVLYREVYCVRLRKMGVLVVFKKIIMYNEKDGFLIMVLREIKLFKLLLYLNIF